MLNRDLFADSSTRLGKVRVMREKLSLSVVIVLLVTLLSCPSHAQTLQPLVNQPPIFADLSFLLTDGTVMTQVGSTDWWRLTPDASGSYLKAPGRSLPVCLSQPILFPPRCWLTAGL